MPIYLHKHARLGLKFVHVEPLLLLYGQLTALHSVIERIQTEGSHSTSALDPDGRRAFRSTRKVYVATDPI